MVILVVASAMRKRLAVTQSHQHYSSCSTRGSTAKDTKRYKRYKNSQKQDEGKNGTTWYWRGSNNRSFENNRKEFVFMFMAIGSHWRVLSLGRDTVMHSQNASVGPGIAG